MLIIKIFILLTLSAIAIQELKSYSVYWLLFPALTFWLLLLQYQRDPNLQLLWPVVMMNIILLALQVLLLTIYFSVKNKRLTNITHRLLGLGDILFLLC